MSGGPFVLTLAVILVMILVASHGEVEVLQTTAQPEKPTTKPTTTPKPTTTTTTTTTTATPPTEPPGPSSTIIKYWSQYRRSFNNFSLNYFKSSTELQPANREILVAPVTLAITLSMIQQAATGISLEEIDKILGVNKESSRILFNDLFLKKKEEEEEEDIYVLMKDCYFVKIKEVNDEYSEILLKYYGINIRKHDYPNVEVAQKIMNRDIENKTQGMIKEFFLKDSDHPWNINGIKPRSGAMLADSEKLHGILYSVKFLSGEWETELKINFIKEKFYYNNNKKDFILVKTMTLIDELRGGYNSKLKFKWVELPYKNPEYSLMVVLPYKGGLINDLINKMTPEAVEAMIDNDQRKETELTLPKFEMTQIVYSIQPLKKMGITEVSTSQAKLSIINNVTTWLRDFYQEVTISILENGHEPPKTKPCGTEKPRWFMVNRPFLLFIVNKKFKIPFYIAKIVKPEE